MTDANTDVFHIMSTCRSMRRLKPDPVPEALIYQILDAGIRAPSGGGVQAWRFVVVTDPDSKKKIADIYRRGWRIAERRYLEAGAELDGNMRAAAYLAEHLHEAPVHLFACLRARKIHQERLAAPNAVNFARIMSGSIYPAVQNILLACRALGLGATLTSVTTQYEEEVRAILGLPDSVLTYALIPIGYPVGKFGPVTRTPVEQVTWLNRHGTPFRKPGDEK
ncbi:MAG: nitroreductase family protein [Deltaproteobacteria bacterium]|nr:nitroreductase family protein [Deltaproteobacteria bacterium]